jgi:DNA-binding NarL/FixJ family response regulator
MPKKPSNKTLNSFASDPNCCGIVDAQAMGSNRNAVEDITSFELSGHLCKLVALKESQSGPVIIESVRGSRQYRYVQDEIVHFCLDGKWFALCKESCAKTQMNFLEAQEPVDRKLLFNLTERELQIVQLVCHGLLTKQIAAQLYISEFTVNTYIKTIFNKLGVRSRAAMVYKFTQSNLKDTQSIR